MDPLDGVCTMEGKEKGATSMVQGGAQAAVKPTTPKKRRGRKAENEEELSQGQRNAELGRKGEDAAARFLERHGYEILERNWTCFAGEADIIARDGSSLVFVEVKTRSHCECGQPSEAVGKDKRKRYQGIAACYVQNFDSSDLMLRFDVVSILVTAHDRARVIHTIDAFGSE